MNDYSSRLVWATILAALIIGTVTLQALGTFWPNISIWKHIGLSLTISLFLGLCYIGSVMLFIIAKDKIKSN